MGIRTVPAWQTVSGAYATRLHGRQCLGHTHGACLAENLQGMSKAKTFLRLKNKLIENEGKKHE